MGYHSRLTQAERLTTPSPTGNFRNQGVVVKKQTLPSICFSVDRTRQPDVSVTFCDKMLDKKQLIEEGRAKHALCPTGGDHECRVWAALQKVRSVHRKWGKARHPKGNVLPPARPHLLELPECPPKQRHQLESKGSNTVAYGNVVTKSHTREENDVMAAPLWKCKPEG